MTRFLAIVSGRPTMTDLAVRSAGFIMPRIRATPLAAFILEYDGYWVQLSGDSTPRTIGNASSGAATAQSWTSILYTLIWNNYTQTQCPVLTSGGGASTRGASASADYSANKRLTLPDFRGRSLIGTGTAPSGTTRVAGDTIGLESVTLTTDQLPSHRHRLNALGTAGGSFRNVNVATAGTLDQYVDSSGGAAYVENTGSGLPFNIIQPCHVVDYWISAGARA
ncbi:MAG: hypothetical protein SFY66_18685 [Oculatellaceae cyanobacterium bins.114]|nr:hypothetical protein [Oculatellaceae cyanobacterium bins.114]